MKIDKKVNIPYHDVYTFFGTFCIFVFGISCPLSDEVLPLKTTIDSVLVILLRRR